MASAFNKDLEYRTDSWYLCPTYFLPEIREQYHFAKQIKVTDCTLRDGEQQAGVVFTKDDKVRIAQALDRLGVHEIEVGTPASSEADKQAAYEIAHMGMKKAKATALARAMKQDIDLVADLGVWGANISYPIGDLQRKYKLKVDDETYIERCLEITAYARSKGLHVNFSPYDTTRCNMPFLLKVMEKLHDSGNVDRIRLVDTVGSATPQAMTYYVKTLKSVLREIPLEVHVHNDFGMAMANSMAALCAGAEVVSTTMNGVGERSGNTPTEEVVLTLQLLYGIDLGVDCSVLKETSELVQRLSGVKLARNKAVVGQNCFAHESGLAVAGMKNMPYTSEAYDPGLVGQARRIVLGKKSGKSSIEQVLTRMGFEGFTSEDVVTLLAQVKDVSIANKRAVEEDEFAAMARARLGK